MTERQSQIIALAGWALTLAAVFALFADLLYLWPLLVAGSWCNGHRLGWLHRARRKTKIPDGTYGSVTFKDCWIQERPEA